jgi:hypothetical protein
MAVPGHGETVVSFQLTVPRPGSFFDQPALYLEDSDGLREVKLTVRGEAIALLSPDS